MKAVTSVRLCTKLREWKEPYCVLLCLSIERHLPACHPVRNVTSRKPQPRAVLSCNKVRIVGERMCEKPLASTLLLKRPGDIYTGALDNSERITPPLRRGTLCCNSRTICTASASVTESATSSHAPAPFGVVQHLFGSV